MTNTGGPGLQLNGSQPYKSIGRPLMANQKLPEDFKEFLRLLNDHGVEYLLIGGYAVGDISSGVKPEYALRQRSIKK